ncbi:hypothetical protein J2Z21_000356 [Streptomyces griseochromogenes]|uniref:DoxX family protein n=1 Tax=Streptomyces griseochromogenes TaxID=68214 RepID=A0A1B1B1X8_9ACTN|nr:hypothetical protein [Streptomyces griseochromogenes]ANP52814.1 hypothetical protein AVL59_27650 [Streptomyces griseochromogenes]MBP2047434.1 hypothetical protein [Streptomyces griseochromogenes]
MRNGIRERWRALPPWARGALALYVIGFLEGAGAHALDLTRGGLHVYASFAPPLLQVFFIGLVVLDPLVAVLALLVRPEGIRSACAVMVLDVLANWFADRAWLREDPARLLSPVGLLPITLFGLFVLASTIPLLRVTNTPPGRAV